MCTLVHNVIQLLWLGRKGWYVKDTATNRTLEFEKAHNAI